MLVVASTVLERTIGIPADHLAQGPVAASLAKLVLFSACTYLVALASYTLYEEPLLSGRRIVFASRTERA